MHLSIILLSILLVLYVRCLWRQPTGPWQTRWQTALGLLLFPPLLLIAAALAVLLMGTHGHMLGIPVGWVGYCFALGFLGYSVIKLMVLTVAGWRSIQAIQTYDLFNGQKAVGHILDTPALFAAQIGFWNSQLVVSRGLLNRFNADQIEAVLTHEAAHVYYRDTFWFFWLGWFRQIAPWFPHTDALWQELLLLRELRADRWAAQRVDALLLAESLLLVVQDSFTNSQNYCAAFTTVVSMDRIEERIDALLTASEQRYKGRILALSWLFTALMPLLTLFLHQ